MELLQKDAEGIPIEINIYDAIEEIYKLNDIELAGVLDVSVGVIQYAKRRKTIAKEKNNFQVNCIFLKVFLINFYLHS